jgi:hypothetical protein
MKLICSFSVSAGNERLGHPNKLRSIGPFMIIHLPVSLTILQEFVENIICSCLELTI